MSGIFLSRVVYESRVLISVVGIPSRETGYGEDQCEHDAGANRRHVTARLHDSKSAEGESVVLPHVRNGTAKALVAMASLDHTRQLAW